MKFVHDTKMRPVPLLSCKSLDVCTYCIVHSAEIGHGAGNSLGKGIACLINVTSTV